MREYARATGVGEIPETGDVLAPPTFAACFTAADQLFADPDLGAHRNLVHGSQEYEFHRPVKIGDVLECAPSIAGIVDRGRMQLLTVEVDCTDAETAEPVVTSRSTLIFFRPGES